jgi:hypothetical protein
MTTYETTYGTAYGSDLRVDRKVPLSWSSIWGGTVLGWGALILLSLVGGLVGFASLDPWSARPGSNVGIGSYVWGALELVACAIAGGFLAARFSGSRRRRDAAVHAGIGWALSMVAGTLLAMSLAATAARASAESTERRPAAARTNRALTAGDRARLDRGAQIGTATTAVGAASALLSLAGALAGGLLGAAAASGRGLSDALHARRHHGRTGEDRAEQDQPTILPPTH